jgi:hypothetical protein
MTLPTKPNPRNYTITIKVTQDTYLEVLNEAERQSESVSSTALQTFERGRVMDKLFEFEAYASARFDSEARVALAVYDFVKQMKRDARQDLTRRTNNE